MKLGITLGKWQTKKMNTISNEIRASLNKIGNNFMEMIDKEDEHNQQ
jgi:hypothetical protein